jgi:hypothetical protein
LLAVDGDDDVAEGAAVLEVADGLGGLLQHEGAVHGWRDDAGCGEVLGVLGRDEGPHLLTNER